MAPRELRHAWYGDGVVLGVQIVTEGSAAEIAPKADYDGPRCGSAMASSTNR